MSRERRSDLVFGIILLLLGALFLAAQFNWIPGLKQIFNTQYEWPLIVIGVGVLLFLLGLLTHAPGMSVPACIVGGIGGILFATNVTQRWADWSFLWTLIPGFVGVGVVLTALLGGEGKRRYFEGLRLILISGVLFVIFIMLFSGHGYFIKYWPILIILAGVWIILQTIVRKR